MTNVNTYYIRLHPGFFSFFLSLNSQCPITCGDTGLYRLIMYGLFIINFLNNFVQTNNIHQIEPNLAIVIMVALMVHRPKNEPEF